MLNRQVCFVFALMCVAAACAINVAEEVAKLTGRVVGDTKDSNPMMVLTAPPMTGGAFTSDAWRNYPPATAVSWVQVYRSVRAMGTCRAWAGKEAAKAGTLKLSAQATHNWANSPKGSAFSGMIHCPTGEIYLVPATSRNGLGQVKWTAANVAKMWFAKTSHLGANPGPVPFVGDKLKNIDHGRAAAYLDERNLDPLTLFNKAAKSGIKLWIDEQHGDAQWLGFFVHAMHDTGAVVINGKSAQLNVPNLATGGPEADLFAPDGAHKNTYVGKVDRAALVQLAAPLKNKITQLFAALPAQGGPAQQSF